MVSLGPGSAYCTDFSVDNFVADASGRLALSQAADESGKFSIQIRFQQGLSYLGARGLVKLAYRGKKLVQGQGNVDFL